MSRLYMVFLVLFITYGNCEAFIDNNEVSINLGLRSYPFSGTVDGQIKSEKLLWDAREHAPWKFAMLQSKITLASHGLAEVALSVFPVGFLELGANASTTSRFYETKNFDCSVVVCQGILSRSSVFGRMILGHDFSFGSPFVLIGGSKTILTVADETKPFVDEVEKLIGKAGQDELQVQSIGLGLKRSEGTILVLYRQGKYKETSDKNEMVYLVYRTQIDSFKINTGIGQYQSNRFDSRFSAVLGISFAEGVSASLF